MEKPMNTDFYKVRYYSDTQWYGSPDDKVQRGTLSEVRYEMVDPHTIENVSLRAFATGVSDKLWDTQFYVAKGDIVHNVRYDQIYVYSKNQPCFLGEIYANRGYDGKVRYGVISRHIYNRKKRNTTETVNIKKGISNAATYLRLWTQEELAGIPTYSYKVQRNRRIDEASEKIRSVCDTLGIKDPDGPAMQCLIKQHNTNVWLGTREENLNTHIANYKDWYEKHMDLKGIGRMPVFVRLRVDDKGRDYMIAHYVDAQTTVSDQVSVTPALTYRDTDETFHTLRPKLDVLNVMGSREYVSGVGMKYDDNTFFVVLEDDA